MSSRYVSKIAANNSVCAYRKEIHRLEWPCSANTIKSAKPLFYSLALLFKFGSKVVNNKLIKLKYKQLHFMIDNTDRQVTQGPHESHSIEMLCFII